MEKGNAALSERKGEKLKARGTKRLLRVRRPARSGIIEITEVPHGRPIAGRVIGGPVRIVGRSPGSDLQGSGVPAPNALTHDNPEIAIGARDKSHNRRLFFLPGTPTPKYLNRSCAHISDMVAFAVA